MALAERRRLDAIDLAERCANELVDCLGEALAQSERIVALAHEIAPTDRTAALPFNRNDAEQRLGGRLADALKRITGHLGRLGPVRFPAAARPAGVVGWATAEHKTYKPHLQRLGSGAAPKPTDATQIPHQPGVPINDDRRPNGKA